MQGNCKLYDTFGDLKESHIYPKFVINYIKESGSKYLRNFTTPNKRQQDGIKLHLLSEKAEQEFSKREKWFAENIFREYIENGKKSFDYKEDLFYFTMSFLWRILVIQLKHPNVINQPYIKTLHEVEAEWKFFLKNGKYPLNYDRLYLFFTDRIKSHTIEEPGVDYYFSRALDSTIVYNDSGTFLAVYGKFARFVFWGVIKGGDDTKISDLKINPIGGRLNIPQNFADPVMTSFFLNRIKQINSLPKPTTQQQDKILEEILKDREVFLKSDAGQSITNDYTNLNPKTNYGKD
jgi:hypothetical protein